MEGIELVVTIHSSLEASTPSTREEIHNTCFVDITKIDISASMASASTRWADNIVQLMHVMSDSSSVEKTMPDQSHA